MFISVLIKTSIMEALTSVMLMLCLVSMVFFVLFVYLLIANRSGNEAEEDEEAMERESFLDTSVRSGIKKVSPKKSKIEGYSSI